MEQTSKSNFNNNFIKKSIPVLITKAVPAYEVQHSQRVRKYLILMSFRIPALIFATIAYKVWCNGVVSLMIILISVPLPWIAVLIANTKNLYKNKKYMLW